MMITNVIMSNIVIVIAKVMTKMIAKFMTVVYRLETPPSTKALNWINQ